jgi:hypothetical protein
VKRLTKGGESTPARGNSARLAPIIDHALIQAIIRTENLDSKGSELWEISSKFPMLDT